MRALRSGATSRRIVMTIVAACLGAITLQACQPGSAAASGVSTRFFGIHAPGLSEAFPSTPRGAVDLTTNGVYWPQLEPANDQWSWTELDSLVDNAHAHGAQPLLVLGKTPDWNRASAAAAPSMTAWEDYVRHVVKRYGTRVDYQIWPESNIVENWSGSPRALARLTIAASKIIHRVAKRALVVSPAMVLRMWYQRQFMDKFFAAMVDGRRVGRYVDAIALDLYPVQSGTPEDTLAMLKTAREVLRSHRVSAPIWNVEINYGVAGGHAHVSQNWSNRKQASYVVRNDMLDASAGVRRVYWLGWFHFTEGKIQLVKDDGTTATLAAKALGVVRSWLIHQHVRGCRLGKAHLYTCKLVKAGRASWVYWTTKGKTVVRAPEGSRKVETMTGDVVGTHSGKRRTVTSAPVWFHH